MPTMHILVAEDEATSALTAKRMLEKYGHKVVVVGDGMACLEALQAQDFDLILMDIQMPIMDGVEATREIRKPTLFGVKSTIPIIALTAFAMVGDKEKFLEAGMDGYIAKPMDLEELKQVIERVMSAKKTIQ